MDWRAIHRAFLVGLLAGILLGLKLDLGVGGGHRPARANASTDDRSGLQAMRQRGGSDAGRALPGAPETSDSTADLGERSLSSVMLEDAPALPERVERWTSHRSPAASHLDTDIPSRQDALRDELLRIVRELLDRNDSANAARIADRCDALVRDHRFRSLGPTCRALLGEAVHHRVSASLDRISSMLRDPVQRRLARWLTEVLKDTDQTPRAIASALSLNTDTVDRWASGGTWTRAPTEGDIEALASRLGPFPPELRRLIIARSQGESLWRVPSAAIQQARRELESIARSNHPELIEDRLARRAQSFELGFRRADGVSARHAASSASAVGPAPLRGQVPPSHERMDGVRADLIAALATPEWQRDPQGDVNLIAASWTSLPPGLTCSIDDGQGTSLPCPALRAQGESLDGPRLVSARWRPPHEGLWTVTFLLDAQVISQTRLSVGRSSRRPERARRRWTPGYEALHARWLQELFNRPEGHVWFALHDATSDRSLNLLWNHRGLDEDAPEHSGGIELRPDCADFPYHLRAYFAWKLGLPSAFPRCRDDQSGALSCDGWDHEGLELGLIPLEEGGLPKLRSHLALAAIDVNTTTLRADLWEDQALLYPTEVTLEALRPGTVFVDPFSHTLVLLRWEVRPDGSRMLLAVDAQPGGFVSVKRFSSGSFVFSESGGHAGAGFKVFRPAIRTTHGIRLLSNSEIEHRAYPARLSYEQASMGREDFYDRMDDILEPHPRSATTILRERLDAVRQLAVARARVTDRAQAWQQEHPDVLIEMPSSRRATSTHAAWEELSTICRDLRFHAFIRQVIEFPMIVRRHPERFTSDATLDGSHDPQHLLVAYASTLPFHYRASDGEVRTSSVARLIRDPSFLMRGYNPNDCPERRWGDPPSARCRRALPAHQVTAMQRQDLWFENGYGCQ